MNLCIFFVINLSVLSGVASFSDLMTCSKWPNMAIPQTNGFPLGNMGTGAASFATNKILVNGAAVVGNTGTYTPGSTVTISLSPYSGQLVFEANGGAVFQGAAGQRNVNGIISGCTSVSRYQMYTSTTATLKMPSSGTVKIQCNFATRSGSGATLITNPITLTAAGPVTPPSSPPVPSPTIKPVSPPTRFPTLIPSKPNPTPIATKIPVGSPSLTPVRAVTPPSSPPVPSPTIKPVSPPTRFPTLIPSKQNPTPIATKIPVGSPSISPIFQPTQSPSASSPTKKPTSRPTFLPGTPTTRPTSTFTPIKVPTRVPSKKPSKAPTKPTISPTKQNVKSTNIPSAAKVFPPTLLPSTDIPTMLPSEELTATPTFWPTEAAAGMPTDTGGNIPPVAAPTTGAGAQALGSTTMGGNQSLIFIVAFLMSVACVIAIVIGHLMYRSYTNQTKQDQNDEDAEMKAADVENVSHPYQAEDEDPEFAVESTKFISSRSNGSSTRRSERALTRPLSIGVSEDKILENPMIYNKSTSIVQGRNRKLSVAK